MNSIHDIADYIIWKTQEDGRPLNLLKLQKLAYYVQAWHLAYHGKGIVSARFQAWVHGPVNRDLYDRFNSSMLYDAVTIEHLTPGFDPCKIPQEARNFIDGVLDAYGPFTGSQLEALTHGETPWIQARKGYGPTDLCSALIDEKLMAETYRARIKA